MMVQKMAQPMFLPWTFERAQLRQFLAAVHHEPASERLCDVLTARHFDQLWTDPLLVQFLRTRCLLCGLQFHPAEVSGHLHRAHSSDLHDHRAMMPQLLTAMSRENQHDHQCELCTQIYNYPAHGHEDAQELTDRSVLAQIHLQHQCPVALQTALLLQDHGLLATLHGRGLRNAGDVQADGLTAHPRKVRSTRRRQGEQETQAEWGNARRTRRRNAAPIEGNGPTTATSGCGATSSQTSRLMDLLYANRAAGPAPSAGPEGSRMETEADSEAGDPGGAVLATEMLSGPAPGGHIESEGYPTGQLRQRGPTEESGPGSGSSDPEGQFVFQRWSPQAQSLKSTGQTPISLQRMAKYTEQLMEILKDPSATVKFTSLRPMSADAVVPWIWQISMRADDLQILLTTLQGCTVWALLGLSMKPHALHQSKQGQQLQTMLGKGQGKAPSKGKGKHQNKAKVQQ